MPEPLDTIRRVNSDEHMSAEELRQACATLDRHTKGGKTDVVQARRRAGQRLEKLMGGSATGDAVRQVSLHDAIYSGSQRPPAKPKAGGSALGGFVVLLLIVAVVYGCTQLGDESGSSTGSTGSADAVGEVSRAEFEGDGRTWPLTIERGTLNCQPANRVIFNTGGTTYAVNGTAKGAHQWADIDPIWADDGSGLGLKVDIGDLIDAGLALCE